MTVCGWITGFKNWDRPRATVYQLTEFKVSLPKRCWCLALGQNALSCPNPNPQNAIGVRPSAFGGLGTHAPGTTSQSILLRLHLQREICRNGCGKTTSMIPLIIFVFGEFGSPGYGGYAEAMEGLADCISCGYAEATIVEVSYAEAMLPFCTNSLPGRCAPALKTSCCWRWIRRGFQQFLKFRFSTGTSVELKLRSTLQQSAGLVVF